MKSIFVNLESQNLLFRQCNNSPQPKFSDAETVKIAGFETPYLQKLISRKIQVAE